MKCLSFTLALSYVAAGLALPFFSKGNNNDFHISAKFSAKVTINSVLKNAGASDVIPGQYIAVYHNNVTQKAYSTHMSKLASTLSKRDQSTMQMYEISGWRAFTIQAADETMIGINSDNEINYIEADTAVKITVAPNEPEEPAVGPKLRKRVLMEQAASTAGLARLSHKDVGAKSYVFEETAGAGVSVFIVDTGILPTHSEFSGRAVMGANFVPNSRNVDENGHGSHVAGTIGGETFGVAKSAKLIGVKVLDANGAGSNSQVIAGLNFITQNVTASNLAGKAVINMSLGGSRSNAVNAAVAAATRAGITMVVAAGNENVDAANSSPASAPSAFTVGAISSATDTRASFSNFGAALDIFAPGVNVLSCAISSNTATTVLSGTSMASPHVAGLAAYVLSIEGAMNSEQMDARLKALARDGGGVARNAGAGSTTAVAYNGSGV